MKIQILRDLSFRYRLHHNLGHVENSLADFEILRETILVPDFDSDLELIELIIEFISISIKLVTFKGVFEKMFNIRVADFHSRISSEI